MRKHTRWVAALGLLLASCGQPDQAALTRAPQPTVSTQDAVAKITYPGSNAVEYVGRAEWVQLRDKLAPGISEEAALDEVVSRRLLLHEAQAADFVPDPAAVEQVAENVKGDLCNRPDVQAQFPANAPRTTPDEIANLCAQTFGFTDFGGLRAYLSEQQMINQLIKREAAGQEIHAAHILLMVMPQPQGGQPLAAAEEVSRTAEIERRRPEIELLYQQVLEPNADFAAIADAKTEDPSGKGSGGDLGFSDPGAYVPEFSTTLLALKDGEISAPVLTAFGWHIIKRFESRKAAEASQEAAAAYQQKLLVGAKAANRVEFLVTPRAAPTVAPPVALPTAQTAPNVTATVTQ